MDKIYCRVLKEIRIPFESTQRQFLVSQYLDKNININFTILI